MPNNQEKLFKACKEGRLEAVNELLEQEDIDVNRVNKDGHTLLTLACYTKSEALVNALWDHKDSKMDARSYHYLSGQWPKYENIIGPFTKDYFIALKQQIDSKPGVLFDFPFDDQGKPNTEKALMGYYVLRHLVQRYEANDLDGVDIQSSIELLLAIPSINTLVITNTTSTKLPDNYPRLGGRDFTWQTNELLYHLVKMAHYSVEHEAIRCFPPEAQYQLGLMFNRKLSRHMAACLIRLAAEQNHANAQYKLGIMCKEGLGVSQDYDEAIAWYVRAAEQGHQKAQDYLNDFYNMLQRLRDNDPTFRTLVFKYERLTKGDMQQFTAALATNTMLQQLTFPREKFLKPIRMNFMHWPHSLESLELGHSQIGDNNAKGLTDALKVNNTLRVLLIAGGEIDDHGAKAFADVLATSTSLREFTLIQNPQISPIGTTAIVAAVATNNSLQHLEVNNVTLAADALEPLYKQTERLYPLNIPIDCGSNLIDEERLKEQREKNIGMLFVNYMNTRLNYGDNHIPLSDRRGFFCLPAGFLYGGFTPQGILINGLVSGGACDKETAYRLFEQAVQIVQEKRRVVVELKKLLKKIMKDWDDGSGSLQDIANLPNQAADGIAQGLSAIEATEFKTLRELLFFAKELGIGAENNPGNDDELSVLRLMPGGEYGPTVLSLKIAEIVAVKLQEVRANYGDGDLAAGEQRLYNAIVERLNTEGIPCEPAPELEQGSSSGLYGPPRV